MAVSNDYLNSIGFATIRREPDDDSDTAIDKLLIEYIEQARADMISKGAKPDIVNDETNASVRGCVQSYVRWRMSYDNKDGAKNLEEYRLQLDELRKACYE